MADVPSRWVQDLRNVSEDKRVVRVAAAGASASEAVGIDGNHEGSVRPFPGFLQVYELGFDDATDVRDYRSEVLDIKAVSFKIGSSGYGYGFVYKLRRCPEIGNTPSDKADVLMDYYNSLRNAWTTGVIVRSSTDVPGIIDVSVLGRLIFVFTENEGVSMVYADDATPWATHVTGLSSLSVQPGPGLQPQLWSPDLALQQTTPITLGDLIRTGTHTSGTPIADEDRPGQGQITLQVDLPSVLQTANHYPAGTLTQNDDNMRLLPKGDYAFAYYLYNSVSGRKSALSNVAEIKESDFTSDSMYVVFDLIYDHSKFDQAYIYRSVRTQGAGGVYTAGVLHLDKVITLEDYAGGPGGTTEQDLGEISGNNYRSVYYYELEDKQLIFQDTYAERGVYDQEMPAGSASIFLDTTLLVGNITSTNPSSSQVDRDGDSTRGLGETRWSSLVDASPELFPPLNRYIPEIPTNSIISFKEAGGNVIGFSRNGQFFIRKESTYIRAQSLHEGYGIVGPDASDTVGSLVYFVTSKGVKTVAADGQLDDVRSLNRLIMEEWGATELETVSVAFDPTMAALFIHNPTQGTTAIMWFNTARVTEIVDSDFLCTFKGVWPLFTEEGEQNDAGTLVSRAFFLQNLPFDGENDAKLAGKRPRVFIVDDRRLKKNSATDQPRFSMMPFNNEAIYLFDGWDAETGYLTATPVAGSGWCTDCVGLYFYIVEAPDPDLVGQRLRIVNYYNDGGTGKYVIHADSWGVLPDPFNLEGVLLSLSPVYTKWVGTPLGMQDEEGQQFSGLMDFFRVRYMSTLGVFFSDVSHELPNDYEYLARYAAGAYEGQSADPKCVAYPRDRAGSNAVASIVVNEPIIPVAMGDDFTGSVKTGKFSVQATAAVPFFQTFITDVDYQTPAALVTGRVSETERTQLSS